MRYKGLSSFSIFLLAAALVFLQSSCTNSEIGNSDDVNPEAVFFDYKVWGSEQDSLVTVRLQYRFAGRNGTTLLLQDSSHVMLDGAIIPVDSSRFLGAYYEVVKPAHEFGGRHNIVFTGINQKQYSNGFDFPIVFLKDELPAKVKREDIILNIGGTQHGGRLRIVLTDTSFYGRGIEKIDSLQDGSILISKEELGELKSGPVYLEIVREEEKRLSGTREGGRLSIWYGLKREFVLE